MTDTPETLLADMAEALGALIDTQTSSYCEWCESHAEKDDDGNPIGPVIHKIGCPYLPARTTLARYTAYVESRETSDG